jgi:general secretion pathway protein E
MMAIQSALTGHLVFSTLHTNDAASAITRLLDLGVEPYLLGSSVIGVMAQRLVRQVCPKCGYDYKPSPEDLLRLGIKCAPESEILRGGKGCASCRMTGYRGRIGIFELLLVDEAIRAKLAARSTASEIKSTALARGMKALRDDGIIKAFAGQTTIEEVLRVTMRANV